MSQYNQQNSNNISKTTQVNRAPKYPARNHGRRERKVLQTASKYAPTTAADWVAQPATMDDALDQIAAQTLKTVKVTYDFAVNGGAISTIDLGVGIPNKCIVTQVVQDILTAPTSADSMGTVKLVFPTDGNLSAAVTADGSHSGASLESTGNAKKTTAARELSATIATTALTAGKITWWVTYVQSA